MFISYASEDRQNFVEPLARCLSVDIGLNVWYDDFCLEVGDSLSASIDRGLHDSKYGTVVISKSFMSKKWPQRELSGLVILEQSQRGKRILPIWHGVTQRQVADYSPTLADKIGINTSEYTFQEIAILLTKVVRPEIFNNIYRHMLYQQWMQSAPRKTAKIERFWVGPKKHQSLSDDLVLRAKMIYSLVGDAVQSTMGHDLDKFIDCFLYDLHPDREIAVWEKIAIVYHDLTVGKEQTRSEMNEIFLAAVAETSGNMHSENYAKCEYVTESMIKTAFQNAIPRPWTK